jgi:hypothetical protein
MREEVRRDLSRSAAAFSQLVWPLISERCGGGEIVQVESETDAKTLDVMAGIDAWQVVPKLGVMRGIASRVQWGSKSSRFPYNTFTIRYNRPSGHTTEFAKRLQAIEAADKGWLYPHLTIQAYLDGDTVLSVGVVRTADLFAFAEENRRTPSRDTVYFQNNFDHSSNFLVVPWEKGLCEHARVLSISEPGEQMHMFSENGQPPLHRRLAN